MSPGRRRISTNFFPDDWFINQREKRHILQQPEVVAAFKIFQAPELATCPSTPESRNSGVGTKQNQPGRELQTAAGAFTIYSCPLSPPNG